MKAFSQFVKTTIPANGELPAAVTGSFFLVKESNGRFLVKADDQPYSPMEVGLGFRMPGGEIFRRLQFKNETASPIEIEYYAGSTEIIDNRLNQLIERLISIYQKQAPVVCIPGRYDIAAGQEEAFPGVNAGRQRHQIVLTNFDAALDVHVNGSFSGSGHSLIPPRTPWSVVSSSALWVRNPNAQAVTVGVLEFFYTS